MFVSGRPQRFLRLDGLVLLTATVLLFAGEHQHWWLYPALILVPDVSVIGYLHGPKSGALLYNVGHSYLAPAALIFAGWRSDSALTLALGLIWLGHVGMDRALGYGLKYDEGFACTHLGRIGPTHHHRAPYGAGSRARAGRKCE
jgi:hypothetical protein